MSDKGVLKRRYCGPKEPQQTLTGQGYAVIVITR